MAENSVSEELCQSRRDTFNVKLNAIQAETSEIRKGVGKMLRIVTEGNGSPALVTSVAQNASFRKTMEEWLVAEREVREAKERQDKRDREQYRRTMLLTSGGWLITIVLFAVSMVLKP